jgi:DNA polymerase III subunit epsilon
MNTEQLAAIYDRRNFVVLDTETTGLKRPAEICQIAIVDWQNEVLINTYVKTRHYIPDDATAIHGITDDMVSNSPIWPEIKPAVMEAIAGKDVLVYNAVFDRHMMHASDDAWQMGTTDYKVISRWECVMLWYADVWGAWDDWHGSNKWQQLGQAYVQCGGGVGNAHDAFFDCQMTRFIMDYHIKKYSATFKPE